jgi:predicted nucleic acid-binding Zn ribbon protein
MAEYGEPDETEPAEDRDLDANRDLNVEADLDPELDLDPDLDPDAEDDDDPARAALAGARGSSRTSRRRPTRRRRRPDEPGRNRGGYSAPGPDPARDPQRLGALLPGYVADLGWEQPLADARVFAQWSSLVGAEVAAHCEPQSLRDGELRITAESTAWATQLRMLASTLLARLVAELGPQVVTKLVISGPTAPSWKHGPRSLRNGRGPRDTYG